MKRLGIIVLVLFFLLSAVPSVFGAAGDYKDCISCTSTGYKWVKPSWLCSGNVCKASCPWQCGCISEPADCSGACQNSENCPAGSVCIDGDCVECGDITDSFNCKENCCWLTGVDDENTAVGECVATSFGCDRKICGTRYCDSGDNCCVYMLDPVEILDYSMECYDPLTHMCDPERGAVEACVPYKPTVTVEPEGASLANHVAGQYYDHEITVKNEDSSACSESDFRVEISSPDTTSWQRDPLEKTFSLDPQESGIFNLRVWPDSIFDEGVLNVKLTITNEDYPSYDQTKNIAYTTECYESGGEEDGGCMNHAECDAIGEQTGQACECTETDGCLNCCCKCEVLECHDSDYSSLDELKTSGVCYDNDGRHEDTCSGGGLITEFECSGYNCAYELKDCNNYDCKGGFGCSVVDETLTVSGNDYSCWIESEGGDYCKNTGSKTCEEHTCGESNECGEESCSDHTYVCYYSNSGSYTWSKLALAAETDCDDGHDNDCDDKIDANDTDCPEEPEPEPECVCTSWENQQCGNGCPLTEMTQARSCTPDGCDEEERCAENATCVSEAVCDKTSTNIRDNDYDGPRNVGCDYPEDKHEWETCKIVLGGTTTYKYLTGCLNTDDDKIFDVFFDRDFDIKITLTNEGGNGCNKNDLVIYDGNNHAPLGIVDGNAYVKTWSKPLSGPNEFIAVGIRGDDSENKYCIWTLGAEYVGEAPPTTTTTQPHAGEETITIYQGTNIIGIQGLSHYDFSHCDLLYYASYTNPGCMYDNNGYLVYYNPLGSNGGDCGSNFFSTDDMHGGFGYYLYANKSCEVTFDVPSGVEVDIHPGTNVISVPVETTLNEIAEVCGDEGVIFTHYASYTNQGCLYDDHGYFVYYDAGNSSSGDCGSKFKSGPKLEPFIGYYVYFNGKNGDGSTPCMLEYQSGQLVIP